MFTQRSLPRAIAVGVALTLAATMPTTVQARPAGDATGACTLKPGKHLSDRHEWGSCLSVSIDMPRAPRIGQAVPIHFTVAAQRAQRDVRIQADLPGNLDWAKTPPQMTSVTRASAHPQHYGRLRQATTRRDLRAGQRVSYTAAITATAPGAAEIRVRVMVAVAGGTDAAEDIVFLTVGAPGKASMLDIAVSALGETAPITGAPAAAAQAGRHAPAAGPSAHSDDPPSGQPAAQATACVTGGWFFVDHNGVTRPAYNETVQVWDYDSTSADDLLAIGVVSTGGRYNLCFDNDDGAGGGQDVYVRYLTENSLWRVRRTGTDDTFAFKTETRGDVANGSTTDFGNLQPANNSYMRGLNAFQSANAAWNWVPGVCWDDLDSSCRQVVINWAPNSTDGTFYDDVANEVHLRAIDPDAPITVVHEIGHGVMDDVYEDAYPDVDCSGRIGVQWTSSAGCAWTEGWAEWFAAMVFNDPFMRWPNGQSTNLETPAWGTIGWQTGDTVEGRVAGALIDISDSSNEGYWDRYGEGDPGNIWYTFTHHVSNTFAHFWSHRLIDGFNRADTGALASVYQNTIDYTFRDPLNDYIQRTRPTPTPHNYGYNTSTHYWSAVAVRPPAGADYGLRLYDSRSGGYLNGSFSREKTVEFVAVDSNHRALGDYYPQVFSFSGSGDYEIELAQGSTILAGAPQSVYMGSSDVVVVRDVFLWAGTKIRLQVTPGNNSQDAELFLISSAGGNPIRSRNQAVASSTFYGNGAAEIIYYTPAVSDWYGLVLISKEGSGHYTLQKY